MSSTLAMVLMAAMAVPGNGPEMVSGEMMQEPQPLNLSGKWVGTWQSDFGDCWPAASNVRFDGVLVIEGYRPADIPIALPIDRSFIDEGGGRLRIPSYRGIFEQHDDRIVICFRHSEQGYPAEYRGGNGQHLIILHRVKPRR